MMMVRAIQIDSKGAEVAGTERDFTPERWMELQRQFGKTLRWKQCTAKAVKTKSNHKHNNEEDEKTDFPFDGGGTVDAPAD
jgi:hypothetical protein